MTVANVTDSVELYHVARKTGPANRPQQSYLVTGKLSILLELVVVLLLNVDVAM
jgi:hypothetical protein